jgi:hypothetical protein
VKRRHYHRQRPDVQIVRAWVASCYGADGSHITITIHGANVTEAEQSAERERPGARIVARRESTR